MLTAAHRPGRGAQDNGNVVRQIGCRPSGLVQGFSRCVDQQARCPVGTGTLPRCELGIWQKIRKADLTRLMHALPGAIKHRDVAESWPAHAETGRIGLPSQPHRREDTRTGDHDAIDLLDPMVLTVSRRHGNRALTCSIQVRFSRKNSVAASNPWANYFSLVMTLYKSWEKIVQRFPEALALTDWKTGRRWTFHGMQHELDRREVAKPGSVLFPRGWEVDLVFETLRAWRDGVILCPVESEAPDPGLFHGIPAGIVHVKMTSGSTAAPKLILFNALQLAADATNVTETMGLEPGCPNLGVISMSHSYGFSNLVTPLLLHGVPLVWLGDPLPGSLSAVFERLDAPCALPAVPAMWRAWAAAGIVGNDVVKLAVSAGAPLSLEIENRLYQDSGVKIHNFYGSSECGGIAFDRSREPRTDPACVGTAMANVHLALGTCDSCLVVESAAVGEGYWPLSESNTTFGKGVFLTSDLVEITQTQGEVLLRARASDTINVAGRKVAPGKIEAAILSADGRIRHCVVFGVPSEDPERVEDIIACVSADSEGWDSARVKSRILQTLAGHETPRQWWLHPDLKPDSRGKLSRRIWREKFLDRQVG